MTAVVNWYIAEHNILQYLRSKLNATSLSNPKHYTADIINIINNVLESIFV